MNEKILSIHSLSVHFSTYWGTVKAVDGVDLEMDNGEITGLVGETGCGKSMTALSILRLVPSPGRIVDGEIVFKGENLLKKSDKEIRKVRGREISMIFQDPMSSLNPVYQIGDQIAETVKLHQDTTKKEALDKTLEMLASVNLPDPSSMMEKYPHELSGGMRQRVMIAMALACKPSLVLADEPTTLLDVTTQAQILNLVEDLQKKTGTSMLWITHNFGVVGETCDKVAVMYAGTVVEWGDVYTIFEKPKHPYTMGLMRSIPRLDKVVDVFETMPGTLPDPVNLPPGCRYYPRCQYAEESCDKQQPMLVEQDSGHFVRCFKHT